MQVFIGVLSVAFFGYGFLVLLKRCVKFFQENNQEEGFKILKMVILSLVFVTGGFWMILNDFSNVSDKTTEKIVSKNEVTISTPEEDAKEVVKLLDSNNPRAEEILQKKTDLYLTQRGEEETHRFLDLARELKRNGYK